MNSLRCLIRISRFGLAKMVDVCLVLSLCDTLVGEDFKVPPLGCVVSYLVIIIEIVHPRETGKVMPYTGKQMIHGCTFEFD